MLRLPLLLVILCTANAFKWHLKDTLPAQKVLTFSERYMFSTENGPPMLEQGAAYIHIDVSVLVYMAKNESAYVGYAVFAAAEDHHHDSLMGICDNSVRDFWASKVSSSNGNIFTVIPL